MSKFPYDVVSGLRALESEVRTLVSGLCEVISEVDDVVSGLCARQQIVTTWTRQ
jgi:hypothetical protein